MKVGLMEENQSIETQPPERDPWDALFSAGKDLDTFVLLLGPVLITCGICLILGVLAKFHSERKRRELEKAMEEE